MYVKYLRQYKLYRVQCTLYIVHDILYIIVNIIYTHHIENYYIPNMSIKTYN